MVPNCQALFYNIVRGVKMTGIYKITNLKNQKVYIGQSINIHKRWINHKASYNNPKKECYNYPLYKAFRKYGIENFSFEVIEECKQEDLNSREIFWISYYNSYSSGYNQNEGGSFAHYNKLSKKLVLEIIKILQTSNENSEEIGKRFGVSGRTVRAINSGESCHMDNYTYPIRPKMYNTHGNKGFVKSPKKKNAKCPICNKNITGKTNYCAHCAQRKVEKRPEPIQLAKEISEFGFEGTGRKYNVSGTTIKKWCKGYNIPHLKNEIIQWYKEHS